MSSSKKPTVAGIVTILGEIIGLIGKAIGGGKDESVKKILGSELHTTLIKTRADLEALDKFK